MNLLRNNTTDNVQDSLLPKYWYYLIASALTGTSIFGTIENSIVIILFCKVKSLRSTTNMFIASLAISDLLMCVFAKPFVIASYISRVWIFSDSGCTFYGFLVYFLGLTSMYNLSALSFQRYIVITKPIFATRLTHSVVGTVIAGCWLLGSFWAILPLFGWNSYELEVPYTSCSVVWDSKEPLRISYNITIFFTCFFIPVFVMGYSYIIIYLKVRKIARSGSFPRNSRITRKNTRNEKKIAKSVFVMIGAFLMSWTPYAFISFWTVFGDTKALPVLVKTLPQIMAKCASVWNPIIYVSTNKQFRSAFLSLFIRRRTSFPDDTITLSTTRLAVIQN